MRELVAINAHGYYDIIWDIHHSQGFNYTNPEDAVVVAWRGGGRWLTYIW